MVQIRWLVEEETIDVDDSDSSDDETTRALDRELAELEAVKKAWINNKRTLKWQRLRRRGRNRGCLEERSN